MVIWHLGLMKTASTFLQKNVFPYVQDLSFLGWFGKGHRDQWINSDLENAVSSYRQRRVETFAENENFLSQKLGDTGQKYLISEEGLLNRRDGLSEFLNSCLKVSSESRFVVSIRSQDSYLYSQYMQFRRGVHGNKAWKNCSPARWLETYAQKYFWQLDYNSLISTIEKQVSRSRIFVIPYEQLLCDRDVYVGYWANALGMNSVNGLNELFDQPSEHSSAPGPVIKALSRGLQIFPGPVPTLVENRYVGQLYFKHFDRQFFKIFLNEMFPGLHNSNRELSEKYLLELDRLDYL